MRVLLWYVQFFSEVILAFHEVGEALMRDVEEVDEGLHITALK